MLRFKKRFIANKSIEAQANGSQLRNSKLRLYLHPSNSPPLLQTRRTFHIQHINLVQGLTHGDDPTGTLVVLIS